MSQMELANSSVTASHHAVEVGQFSTAFRTEKLLSAVETNLAFHS